MLSPVRHSTTEGHAPTLIDQTEIMASGKSLTSAALLFSFLIGASLSAWAGNDKTVVAEPPAPPSRLHGLLNIDVSDHYITPRGLNVENKGVIFQPLLLLFWNLYHNDSTLVSDVTLTTGIWNSVHTEISPGADPGHWNELDPIVGLTAVVAKDWKLDLFFTAFISETDAYQNSTNIDFKVSYDDTGLLGAFALHPSVEFFGELTDKATVAFAPGKADESFYFQFNINPQYTFEDFFKIKVELPTYFSVVGDEFYQKFNGSPGGAGIGLFSTMFKVSAPLTFVPPQLGSWTIYGGVAYYYLNNPGLLDGNQVLASAERTRNLVQFRGGLSIFF